MVYDSRLPPTTDEITHSVLQEVSEFPRWAEEWLFSFLFCQDWSKAGLTPRKSRYSGTFELSNGVLATPILILSPVARFYAFPAVNAKPGALQNYGGPRYPARRRSGSVEQAWRQCVPDLADRWVRPLRDQVLFCRFAKSFP